MALPNPWMPQGLFGSDTLHRIIGQHSLNKILGCRTDPLPPLLRVWHLSFQDQFEYLCIAGSNEGGTTSEHDIQDNS